MANEESSGGLNRSIGPLRLFVLGTASIVGPWLVMTNWWISLTGSSIALAFSVLACYASHRSCLRRVDGDVPRGWGAFVYIKSYSQARLLIGSVGR